MPISYLRSSFAIALTSLSIQALPASLSESASALPAETNLIFAMNFSGFENEQSLLSYIPTQELTASMREMALAKGEMPPVDSAMEAALRIAFLEPETVSTLDFMVVGATIDPADPQPSNEKIILVGSFTASSLLERYEPIGLTAGESENIMTLPMTQDRKMHLRLTNGSLYISADEEWSKNASAEGEAPALLLDQQFASEADAILMAETASITPKDIQPQVRMMTAPLLQSKAIAFALLPGETPSVNFFGTYANEGAAQTGAKYFEQMLALGKGQIQMLADRQKQRNPEAAQQMVESSKWIEDVVVTHTTNMAKMTLNFTDLPSRDEVRQDIIDAMDQVMKAADQLSAMGAAGAPNQAAPKPAMGLPGGT